MQLDGRWENKRELFLSRQRANPWRVERGTSNSLGMEAKTCPILGRGCVMKRGEGEGVKGKREGRRGGLEFWIA